MRDWNIFSLYFDQSNSFSQCAAQCCWEWIHWRWPTPDKCWIISRKILQFENLVIIVLFNKSLTNERRVHYKEKCVNHDENRSQYVNQTTDLRVSIKMRIAIFQKQTFAFGHTQKRYIIVQWIKTGSNKIDTQVLDGNALHQTKGTEHIQTSISRQTRASNVNFCLFVSQANRLLIFRWLFSRAGCGLWTFRAVFGVCVFVCLCLWESVLVYFIVWHTAIWASSLTLSVVQFALTLSLSSKLRWAHNPISKEYRDASCRK